MRVAIVTEQTRASSSTNYRAVAHVPRLASRLGEVDLLIADADVDRGHGRVDQVRFFSRHAVRYVRRGLELGRVLGGYDAALVQRGVYPMGPGWAVRGLERFGGRVVYDLDDAVFELAPVVKEKGRAGRWLYAPQQALRLLARADAVVASTQILADALPGRRADAVLPTIPDPSIFPRVQRQSAPPLRVGWTGTAGNVRYLDPLAGVFERLERDDVARLEVIAPQAWSGPSSFHRWRLEEEPDLFARFEVGLMPLPDTPYTRGKAGFKLLQYMAAGAAVVASPVGVNVELVERSGAGYLAGAPDEWERHLRRLAADAELRRELGERGRAFTERYADLDGQANTLARLLTG